MKLVCIHNPHVGWNITEGKIYEVFNHIESSFSTSPGFIITYIIDDLGGQFILEGNYHYFLDLDIHRKEQLEKLGI